MDLPSISRAAIGDMTGPWFDVPDWVFYLFMSFAVFFFFCWVVTVAVEWRSGTHYSGRTYQVFANPRTKWWLLLGTIVLVCCHEADVSDRDYKHQLFLRRVISGGNLASLAKAITAYAATKPPILFPAHPGDTAHTAALILAETGKLNDVAGYFFREDSAGPKTVPDAIGWPKPDGQWKLNPDFAQTTLSVEFAANLPPDSPPDTPVAWTRGLRPDGTWAPNPPLEVRGGFIILLNGQVEFAEKLSLEAGGVSLHKFNTATPTVNILEALPPGAFTLPAGPVVPTFNSAAGK